jgi:signal peptidase II
MLRFGLGVAAAVIAADQVSKALLMRLVADGPVTLAPFLDLVMVWNRGVSFGLFGGAGAADGQRWLLVGLSLAVVVALLVWLARTGARGEALAIGLVVGGALGNVVDRLRFGAVADFFDFHLAGYHWPAFNLADSAIVCGVGLLVIESLFVARRKG